MTAPAAADILASADVTPPRGVHRNLSFKELQHSASGGASLFAGRGKNELPEKNTT